jgi:hypothetical protein
MALYGHFVLVAVSSRMLAPFHFRSLFIILRFQGNYKKNKQYNIKILFVNLLNSLILEKCYLKSIF